MTQPANAKRLFIAACGGIFMFGIVLALLGTLFGLPQMRERLGIDFGRQGDLFLVLYFGIFCATLTVGPSIDRFGNRAVLVISSGLMAAAFASFAYADSFATAAAAAALLGLGGGGLNTSTNALVSDLYQDERGPMLNLLGIFFGFGALFMPFATAGLSQTFSIRQLLLMAAGLAVICMLAYAAMPFPPAREKLSFSLGGMLRVARDPHVLLLGFVLFFASGNEASVGGWISTYLGTMQMGAQTATWVLAGFWAALMIGRLLAAYILRVVPKEKFVLLTAMAAALGCGWLLAARSLPMIVAGAVLTGLAFAGVFPTVLAIAGDRYARFAGTVFGVLFAIALVGGMTFPWAIGHMSERFGVRAGMYLPLAGSAAIAILALVVLRNPGTTDKHG